MDSSALTVPQLFSTLWRGRYLLAFLAISAALIGLWTKPLRGIGAPAREVAVHSNVKPVIG
jgi:hypothetical protein